MTSPSEHMSEALSLAKKGLLTTRPNPMVGCVITLENKIIGRGWHQKAGEGHAEVNAIQDVFENLGDEATSSLDSETESKIQEALKILTKNKTTVVIAHRLSTILNSNKIYVIDSGKIVDSGKHEDLLANSSLYRNFYEKQIQK